MKTTKNMSRNKTDKFWNKPPMITQLTNILTLTFFIISLFSYGSLSSAIASQEDVNVILSMGITQDGEDIHQLVENQIENYLKSQDISLLRDKEARGEIYLGYEIEEIHVGAENKDWAKHRVIAYERAFIEAQNRFISSQGIEIKTEIVKELYSNASGKVPEFKKTDLGIPQKYQQILGKIIAYGEGRLDQGLEKLGISPSEFSIAPEVQRTTMLKDALEKTAFTRTIGEVVGLLPLQTFEGQNSKGNHAIGVVVIYSPKLKQFTHDILFSRGNIQPKTTTGQSLFDRISNIKKTLYNDFGVRQVVDENGYPVLISFGQWANSAITRDDRLQRRYRKIAEKQARSIADNAIAIFLAGTAVYNSESSVGNSIERHFDIDTTGYIEEVILKDIIDDLREKSRSQARANVVGLSDLYKWTIKHPIYGHEIVGVVRMWSPLSERGARNLKNWKPHNANELTRKNDKEKPTPETKVIRGNEYMKPEDF